MVNIGTVTMEVESLFAALLPENLDPNTPVVRTNCALNGG